MAEIKVPYEYAGRRFEGMLVYDDAVAQKRPSVLMQPDWLGVCRHSIDMAGEVAGKDYVVLLADMFGAGYGDREKSFDDLMKSSRAVRNDLDFLLGCGTAAYAALTAEADRRGLIDPARRGAIGYCIGGGFALEQARAGADFQGTVVFHVTLPNPIAPSVKPAIKGRVLALHGSADTVTPKPQMDALAEELTEEGVDWQIMMFGHALHSFCDKGVNNAIQRYDEKLKDQSYRMMRDFFAETF
ncbi:MAG: dienelactone hydrolase family protein [Alphaproteobacteria bacterium]